ncbi:hypothetical protein [Flammeovirga pacifica]|uniref:Uncharacterized protein n=1 Tax=Flammeovirga pacifica TaxID=915059 RepID=A0A1S1Z1C2_FLAPC|nr:hypothetical protein [Flammeovirga pacifica]OHX67069.1 hypothetical protein NH26_12310 [Flammeovirga pacifica]
MYRLYLLSCFLLCLSCNNDDNIPTNISHTLRSKETIDEEFSNQRIIEQSEIILYRDSSYTNYLYQETYSLSNTSELLYTTYYYYRGGWSENSDKEIHLFLNDNYFLNKVDNVADTTFCGELNGASGFVPTIRVEDFEPIDLNLPDFPCLPEDN